MTTRWSWERIGIIAGWVITAIGLLWSLAAGSSQLREQMLQTQRSVNDQEQRIRLLERELPEMRTDVKWIRRELERKAGNG